MSSKVFMMWPAAALVLLLAAVWHWGVTAEPVSAQDAAPDLSVAVAPEWQWMGGRITLTGSGFSPGALAWAFVYSGDGPKDCRSIGVQDNYAGDVVVVEDGSVSFELPVETSVGFAGGEGNYLCLIDRLGVGADLEPVRVSVVVPDPVYRMRLDISSIVEDPDNAFAGTADLPADFSVVDGRHHDNWNLPQERRAGGDVLLRTSGEWRRCQDQPVEGVQLGCVWDEEPAGGGETGKVYLTQVPSDSATVAVPGASLEFRVSLNSDDAGANRAAERFVIFWGPVDLWQLGASGVEPAPYVVQEEHLVGLRHKIVLQSDLDDDGSVTVKIPRSSRNRRDDTFVAIVPCNDDYLQSNFSGEGLEGAMHMLRDCSEVYHTPVDTEEDTREERPGVREAWSQHEVLSGLGMSCYVEIFNNAEPDEEPEWERTIECENNLTEAVTDDEYAECMEVLGIDVEAEDFDGPGGSGWIFCGMGKHRNYDSGRLVYSGTGRTRAMFPEVRYNAARAFYGFTVKWASGDGEFFAPGCSISLLPYLVDGDGEPYAASPLLDRWLTAEYDLDDDVTDDDPRCVAPPEARALSVNFYVPKADEGWSERRTEFYESHPVHFALYVQGMPSAHDYRADDAEQTSGWRRVWLGSWADAADRDGPLRPLGFAYPTRDAESLTLPAVSAMTDGYSIEVSRDYANLNGELELYVVPCRPTYSDQQSPAIQSEGSCEDLPERAAAPLGVAFDFVDNEEGPFGVDDSGESGGYLVNYSAKVRVKFVSVSWNESMARAVSPPAEWDPTEPTGTDCSFASVLPSGGMADDAYWPETTVQGGPCDRGDLSPVRVGFSGVVADNLVVYTTGGRTAGLDLVQMHRATATSAVAPLGRLGIRERRLSLDAGGTTYVLVSPDLAGRDGNVWLVAYSCNGETHGSVRCPLITRGRDAPVYDIAHPPAFLVRVRFLPESGLKHTDIGPVCQGADCNPPMPVLREALPDGGSGSCDVSSYAGGAADLVYWPDRLVRGGACKPVGLTPVSVRFNQLSGIQRDLVVFTTGGRTPGWETIQVNREGGPEGPVPAGAVGLRRVQLSASGRVLVDPDLADAQGRILLLAYLCSDSSDATQPTDVANCPSGRGGSLTTFDVSRRPLFQVLVEYDAGQLLPSGLEICRGDDCRKSHPLGRVSPPRVNQGCGVSAAMSNGRLYWPKGVIAGGDCDRDDLNDVSVQFVLPEGSGDQKVAVHVTGGRSAGAAQTQVFAVSGDSPSDGGTSHDGYRSHLMRYAPYIVPPVSSSGANARIAPAGKLLEEHNEDHVMWLFLEHPALYQVLESKSWVLDGLTDLEKQVVDHLIALAFSETDTAAAAARVVVMPFMREIDELDLLTLRGLGRASRKLTVYSVLDHPILSDGITDGDRVTVIAVSTIDDSSKVTSRLTQGYRVSPGFSCAGVRKSVTVTVVRVSAAVRSDIGSLTCSAVTGAEGVMNKVLPAGHVVLIFDRDSVPPGAGGANYGYATSYLPKYEVEGSSSGAVVELKKTIIHEVAHYYWHVSMLWIDEGLASAFEYILGQQASFNVPPATLLRKREKCGIPNLRALEDAYPIELTSDDGSCDYYLGQRLFLHLSESLGPEKFNQGLRALYAVVESCGLWNSTDCGATVEDLMTAFPDGVAIINEHWGPPSISVDSGKRRLGRLGLREQKLTIGDGGRVSVTVSPDLASEEDEVWLLVYGCSASHGDAGCPLLQRPATGGYDLPKGPDFAVRVKFTEEAGLEPADLRRVCIGTDCNFHDPRLRQAAPSGDDCSVQLSSHWDFWPDRVIRGGGCNFYGTRFGSVNFGADAQEKLVVYSTGGNGDDIEMVPVYGVLEDDDDAGTGTAADPASEQLGSLGLNEHRMDVAAGGSDQVWLRSEMADDDGNVWLFVYRCDDSFNDDGCPLVGRDAVRPSYDIGVRPAFVVRVGFVAGAASGTLDAVCSGSTCTLTAVFRDAAGNTLPGNAEFRVDRGGLGAAGSTALSSRQPHTGDASGGYSFVETLHLPTGGGVVNIEAELLGDGTVLEKTVGVSSSVERISSRVMRCSGDEGTCHEGALELASRLSRGDWFVIEVTGYDAAGDVGFSGGRQTSAVCTDGPASPWPTIALSTDGLRSYNYGTSQRSDRGYAGCAYQVADDAAYGSHGYTVTFDSGGSVLSDSGEVTVGRSAGDLAYLGITGPSSIESGQTGDYHVFGYNSAGLPVSVAAGCVDVTVSGALSGAAACFVEGISSSGQEFTVTANDDVVLDTDSSVGVARGDLSVRKHVLVTPASEDSAPAPVVGDSHISSLAIEQQDTQLRMSWVGSPTAAFASMRAQIWVQIGGVDEFLPGCIGGEPLDTSTHEVFCLLSYGQSGDVYHAAVGYIRHDGSAVPVETAQWVRP